ncbi:MAG: DNA-binding protein HU [Gammaproteobacteria bacterium GWF2_41_13]|nr:MAG: DNA-binding protein HU [Gammaproteobacteria bacterium GWF2_41_13]
MNKGEMIKAIADAADLSLNKAGEILDTMLETIVKALSKDQEVTLIGFGTFKLSKRSARKGRNPLTGETIQIAAKKLPIFKAGKKFKDAVNKK